MLNVPVVEVYSSIMRTYCFLLLLFPLALWGQPGPILPAIVQLVQDTILLDKQSYQRGEVLHARVTGNVKTDGSCASIPLYWIRTIRPVTGLELDPCNAGQMDCGLGSVRWESHALELDLADRAPGIYALVVCDVGEVEFKIE